MAWLRDLQLLTESSPQVAAMGPIVKAQLGLERAGEGKVIKNFATAYNEGKFTTGDLYFQSVASRMARGT